MLCVTHCKHFLPVYQLSVILFTVFSFLFFKFVDEFILVLFPMEFEKYKIFHYSILKLKRNSPLFSSGSCLFAFSFLHIGSLSI